MMSPELFEKLESIARIIRRTARPFGGIQLICVGDFFQLPPVNKNQKSTELKYCFQSSSWERCIGNRIFLLEQNFRQNNDEIY
jgi:ATP-dependent DNA helicase PIF1